jgi:hypothetical protein
MRNKFTPPWAIDDQIHCPFCKLPIDIHLHLEDGGKIVISYDSKEHKVD